jgi:uncharacterized protein (TIGR02118 family)
MIKSITLIKRKPGLSREEFIKYYEEVHVPLSLKHFPTFRRYVRNYVVAPFGTEEPDFDCIMEVWFDDAEGAQAVSDALGGIVLWAVTKQSWGGSFVKTKRSSWIEVIESPSLLMRGFRNKETASGISAIVCLQPATWLWGANLVSLSIQPGYDQQKALTSIRRKATLIDAGLSSIAHE